MQTQMHQVSTKTTVRVGSVKRLNVSGRRDLAVAQRASKLDGTEMAPPDPILGVSEAFKASTNPSKLNLGVGAYRTEDGKPYVLSCVQKAEKRIIARNENHEYLPIEGLDTFRKGTVDLLLGSDSPLIKEGKVACIQSLSGTGSLRVAAAFIARWLKGKTVYISNPTWGNHRNIFGDENVEWKYYRYFDPETVGLDIKGLLEDLEAAPAGSIVLLHGCAHNPTGVDPTPEQWEMIAELCIRKGLLPFFDVAYQGFATGDLDKDAFAPRFFAKKGMEIMVAQSYSKNLGLYGERVGALSVVTTDSEVAKRVLSQLKRLARAIYSNPPTHGARIAAEVINDKELFAEWNEEMGAMAGRIASVRSALQAALEARYPAKDWSFITRQIGMFSFTGLNPKQVDNMTNKHYIFMTRDGRISLAGLSLNKCDYLADAIVDSVKNA